MIIVSIVLFSCNEDSSIQHDGTGKPNLSNQPIALIVVVENNLLINPNFNLAFTYLKDDVLNVLSDIFQVQKSEMENMSLAEIVEIYGENWQINELKKLALPYYDTIMILTDENASGSNLLKSIETLADKGLYIDLLLSLHASADKYISFSDRRYQITEITELISQKNIFIRSLYQTCCYGNYFFVDWAKIKITSVNGSVNVNDIAIFSPIYFLEEWLQGKRFEEAVNHAYSREIMKLRSYNNILPIEEFMLTDEILKNSKQLVSGINKNLKITEFYKEYSNK